MEGPNDNLAFGALWNGSGVSHMLSNAQNDPGFVSIAGGDFHLQANSALIGGGIALDQSMIATGNDVLYEPYGVGTLRKQDGLIDIGAFDY